MIAFLTPVLTSVFTSLTSDLVDEFIESTGIFSVEDVQECPTFERKLIEWLNDSIDIPFLSEEIEQEILIQVVHGVKAMILMRISVD